MSSYPDGESVLNDARLQAEKFASLGLGVIVVEGETDKEVFSSWCESVEQVVVATGKPKVLEAHGGMRQEDRGRILCVVDCDDDVPRGKHGGASDLIITTYADLEADLFFLGILEKIVRERAPDVLASGETLEQTARELCGECLRVAMPLGRVRRAARTVGVGLGDVMSDDIRFDRLRETEDSEAVSDVALDELARLARLSSDQKRRITAQLGLIPTEPWVCNGKDLWAAVRAVLRTDFEVPEVPRRTNRAAKRRAAREMVRASVPEVPLECWDVVRRVRNWEATHGIRVLGCE